MAFPVQAFRPQRSAVEHDERVTSRLNRAGTEELNPMVGSRRDAIDSADEPIGIALNLEFFLNDPLEQVLGTEAAILNPDSTVITVVDLRDKWVLDTVNLKATAKLIIGTDIPSDGVSRRVFITVSTSRSRSMSAQYWVRDLPADAVLFDGVATTVSAPLTRIVDAVDGSQPVTWAVNFFASFNDEVGRQHSDESAGGLISNVVKPYAGAKTVEVVSPAGLVTSEIPVQSLQSHAFAPTSDGQMLQVEYLFRSKEGSADFVRAFGYIKFNVCVPGGEPTTTTATTTPPTIPGGGPPQIEDISIPDPPTFDPDGGAAQFGSVFVEVTSIGVQEDGNPPAAVTLRVTGYKGGVADDPANPGQPLAIADVFVAEQDEIVTATGIYEIEFGAPLADATLIVVSAFSNTITNLGNSLIFEAEGLPDIGFPQTPNVTGVAYNFSTRLLTYNIVDTGWPGESTVTIRVKPYEGIIATNSPQTVADLSVDGLHAEETFAETKVGAQSFQTVFGGIAVNAVVVSFENSFGLATNLVFLDDATSPFPNIKTGPAGTFQLVNGSGTNSNVEVTLTDDGTNASNMDVHYTIVDSNGATVQDVTVVQCPNFPGVFSLAMQAGHDDIDGVYHFWIEGEQGSSQAALVDNAGGSNLLPG